MKLRIKASDMKKIDAHALKTFPYECVGLLIGASGKKEFEVKKIVKAKNTLGSLVAFETDPQFIYKVYKDAEKRGLELIGIYHSHPNLHAFVSSRDAEFMKYWTRIAWLILSVGRDSVLERKAFMMKKGKIEKIEVRVL